MESRQVNHEDIQEARLKQIADFNQAAASIALSSGDANPLYRTTSLEVAYRPDILKPPIEIEFILSNAARVVEGRQNYMTANRQVIESLRGIAAFTGRRGTRLDRIEGELIDREAIVGGLAFVKVPEESLVPEGQTWRLSFQDDEVIWERFKGDAKEPFAVTRYITINNQQNMQAIQYRQHQEGATTSTLDKTALRSLGVWTYHAANMVRDDVYTKPELEGFKPPLNRA